MRVNAFQPEAEPRCGSAALVRAGHLAAVAAERVAAPFAASVAGAVAPSAVYELHWPAAALLADAPAPAAARASAAVADNSYPLLHFQCLEAWAVDAAEDPSRGSESAVEGRCFLDAQQAHSLWAELLPFQSSQLADDSRKVAEPPADYPQPAALRRDSREDDRALPLLWPVRPRSR